MEPAEIRQLNDRLEVTRRELRTLVGQLQERGSTRARLEGALRVLAPSERTAIAQQLRQVASEQAFLQTRTTYLMGRRDQLERDLYAGRLRAKGRADLARRIATRVVELQVEERRLLNRRTDVSIAIASIARKYRITVQAFGATVMRSGRIQDPGDRARFERLGTELMGLNDRLHRLGREKYTLHERGNEIGR